MSISGRVLTSDGAGLRNARVIMTDQSGVTRTALSNAFGMYTFQNVIVGETYLVGVQSRRYTYATRVVQVFDSLAELGGSLVQNRAIGARNGSAHNFAPEIVPAQATIVCSARTFGDSSTPSR